MLQRVFCLKTIFVINNFNKIIMIDVEVLFKEHRETDEFIIEQEEVPVFSLRKLKDLIPIEEIQDGYVSYNLDENGVSIIIIFFDEFMEIDGEKYVRLFYYVSGMGDNLRENRHTYFNDYYFYMNLKLLKSSTEYLMKHFD